MCSIIAEREISIAAIYNFSYYGARFQEEAFISVIKTQDEEERTLALTAEDTFVHT
jgi:hypothetical protein